MISAEEARRYVLSRCRRLAPVEVSPSGSLGLVLAEPVRAADDVPPFANSSMDGYAVRAVDVADVPARLRVVGEIMAGDDPGPLSVGKGEAVRIMTGAVFPAGADAVCMVERTSPDPGGDTGYVVIDEAVVAGTSVRPPGSDIRAGAEVFPAGERAGAAHVGVLTSLGLERVLVYPRPRVGVVSTGDELVSAPGPLPMGKIRDSNRPGLLAQLRADGFEAVDLGQAPDDAGALAAAIEKAALDCDAVLTSGGVSVGDRDIVKLVLGKLGGAGARWLQVAVKPAKPFAFCTLAPDDVPVFGLPGNPVSALVSYELFARPALRLMAGHRKLGRPVVAAKAEVDLRRPVDGKLHLFRVAVTVGPDGTLLARPSGGQGSHQMSALAGADALALVADGEGVAAGQDVRAWLLEPDALASEDVWSGPL
jgi:molybdenum cofactor synthesis domain-containing protein